MSFFSCLKCFNVASYSRHFQNVDIDISDIRVVRNENSAIGISYIPTILVNNKYQYKDISILNILFDIPAHLWGL